MVYKMKDNENIDTIKPNFNKNQLYSSSSIVPAGKLLPSQHDCASDISSPFCPDPKDLSQNVFMVNIHLHFC